MDLVVFGFNDWHEWSETGFRTRSAITTLKLSQRPEIRRVLVVGSASSIWSNAYRSLGTVAGKTPRPGTTLRPHEVERIAENVWILNHSRLVPREDYYPASFRLDGALHDAGLRRSIIRSANDLGMDEIVLWVANPLMAKHIGHLHERVSVFDAIDDWSLHPQKARMRQPILEGYDLAREKADIIFTVSQDLADRLGEGRSGVHWIPNGVDIDRFCGDSPFPPELEDLRRPLVGYVGTLQERVDEEMILAVAHSMPDASVVLVGPLVSPAHFERVSRLSNVHFMGAQPGGRVPGFVEAFDVCILPHVDDEFTRSMDPMKLYEYVAAGKPTVVSGPLSASFDGLVYHATDPDSFARSVGQALGEHDPSLTARRREFARARSWDRVVDRMVSVIDSAVSQPNLTAVAG